MTTLSMLLAAATLQAAPSPAPKLVLARTDAPIVIDGSLDDTVWGAATLVDTFYETAFGDNREPVVKTVVYLLYDDRYLYAGFRCSDPDPTKIRAPVSDRDNVTTADDSVTLMIDARNDRRSAQEFRVNPRGIQADGVFNDANLNEDFSPDFYFDSAARIGPNGWEAELRIPLSSVRYPSHEPQTWGLLIRRNYPRERRFSIYSSPIPRSFNCIVCHSRALEGISRLPSSQHFVLAPYVSGQSVATAPRPGAPLAAAQEDGNAGVDLKWNLGTNTAIDATIRPDFSQVEADVAQVAVNNRFALFFPEKRPFFLEGIDLFDTPIQAVYSRTITSPRFGGRATGKAGATTYTVLAAEDRGGGSVVLPGPAGSSLAAQDFRSTVGVARVRRDLGRSFVGFLATGRDVRGGGHNYVVGPDLQWRRGTDRVAGQFLWSDTRTPNRPDLAEEWDGRRLQSHALEALWDVSRPRYGWLLRYRDFGDGFRADTGFVPQVGYRQGHGNVGASFYPGGFFTLVNPYGGAEITKDRRGAIVNQRVFSNLTLIGKRNLFVSLEGDFDRVRSGGVLFDRNYFSYVVQVDPSRRFPRMSIGGFLGQQVDFANTRLGRGGSVSARMVVRPTDHVNLDLVSVAEWLNVPGPAGRDERLFTAQIQRLKGTYNFDRRTFLRLIGQWVQTKRTPSLYRAAVPRRSGQLQGSALLGFRLNWQSALFLGYGDTRALDEREDLARTDRQIFVKLSYALQR